MGIIIKEEEGRQGSQGEIAYFNGRVIRFRSKGLSTLTQFNSLNGFGLCFVYVCRVFYHRTGPTKDCLFGDASRKVSVEWQLRANDVFAPFAHVTTSISPVRNGDCYFVYFLTSETRERNAHGRTTWSTFRQFCLFSEGQVAARLWRVTRRGEFFLFVCRIDMFLGFLMAARANNRLWYASYFEVPNVFFSIFAREVRAFVQWWSTYLYYGSFVVRDGNISDCLLRSSASGQ